MTTRTCQPITTETIQRLAQQLADYRLGGCPTGGGAAIQTAVRKAAVKCGRSYGELWALVHAQAYQIIDAA